jgi:hypothetical protein
MPIKIPRARAPPAVTYSTTKQRTARSQPQKTTEVNLGQKEVQIMYKFLRYKKYTTYFAPEIDENGAIIRDRNGAPYHSVVSRKECYHVADVLSGGKPYQ